MAKTNKETLKRLLTDYLNPDEKEESVDFSTITDIDKLISCWKSVSSGSEPRRLVEAKMAEVLPTITDIDKLISCWKSVFPSSEPEKLIESRIIEVLKEKLPSITDIDNLISCWKSVSPSSEPRRLIEARMVDILEQISLDNIPEWFESMLQRIKISPPFLEEYIKDKARELLQVL